jgi:hypothetical protein
MSDKKPDIVVWSEERGYYAKELPYGTNLSAPVIKAENVSLWKESNVLKLNHYFESRFEDIKQEYKKLLEEYRWNDLLYKAKYSFEPVLGETYFLYVDNSGGIFLSLIDPQSWKKHPEFIGAFRLDSKNKWERIQ